MSVNNKELIAFEKAMKELLNDVPEIMDQLVVGEGRYARDQARKICKNENIVNTGDYRRNFKSGDRAIRQGNAYKIDVFNNLDYAKPLEYGFRGHFVPGHWEGNTFVHTPYDPAGGMTVPFTPGHHTLERAIANTKKSQDARLERKYNKILKAHEIGKFMD